MFKQTGSPYYYCRWKDKTGKILRKSTGETDQIKAWQVYQSLKIQHDGQNDPDQLTVNTILEIYHNIRGHELKGRGYRSGKKVLLSYFNLVPWNELEQRGEHIRNVRNYIKHRQASHVKPATINREIGILSAAANMAIAEGLQIINHALGNRLSVPKTQYYWLTPEQASHLIQATQQQCGYQISSHLHDYTVIALGTGMRMSEILKLTRRDISRRHNVIRLPTSKSAEPHEIPMTEQVKAAIDSRIAYASEQQTPYLFCNPRTRKPLTSIINQFKHACKRAGIPVTNQKLGITGFRVHDTRHTVASWLIQSGEPLEAVQDLLNHSDLRTTQRYAHHAPEARKKTVGKLPRL